MESQRKKSKLLLLLLLSQRRAKKKCVRSSFGCFHMYGTPYVLRYTNTLYTVQGVNCAKLHVRIFTENVHCSIPCKTHKAICGTDFVTPMKFQS